jgi:hypothetical protein
MIGSEVKLCACTQIADRAWSMASTIRPSHSSRGVKRIEVFTVTDCAEKSDLQRRIALVLL